ncbi:20968c34-9a52-4d92-9752-6b7d3048ccb2 [Sclerotinia trifoliorum]|uniref:Altered inheritance of mitochondria protein 11 n=1 Tax=Sclerotinia trifoliorum TaxID=28548 RepID=A0A8H2VVI2_9HELO|nr:20968c34-9a52-4d92-9752-6b7d3048ccb2 [Sclerotinia trifoliorum]
MAFVQKPSTMADSQPTSSSKIPPAASSNPTPAPDSSLFSQRSRRQFGLFMGGAGFVALSAFVTRRALVRKYNAMLPKFYTPSNRVHEVDGSTEALEALSVATINVASISLMLSGGLLWAFDISTVDDMRQRYRAKMGLLAQETNPEDEKQMEEWVATMMAKLNIDPKEYTAEKGENVLGEMGGQAGVDTDRSKKS